MQHFLVSSLHKDRSIYHTRDGFKVVQAYKIKDDLFRKRKVNKEDIAPLVDQPESLTENKFTKDGNKYYDEKQMIQNAEQLVGFLEEYPDTLKIIEKDVKTSVVVPALISTTAEAKRWNEMAGINARMEAVLDVFNLKEAKMHRDLEEKRKE